MNIGSPIPPWRVPTFIKGTLTFSSLSHLSTQPLVLCCTPSLTASQAWLLESHINDFHIHHTFLATLVSRYMGYDVPWALPSSNFRLPLLTDPLKRVSRSLGLSRNLPPQRCETLFFGQNGRLAFRLIHDLDLRGIIRVLEITNRHFSRSLPTPLDSTHPPALKPSTFEEVEAHTATHVPT
ncbi:MAG: hypothetical protein NPIRA02_31710 [Nitrospirales bacterium]|nr:MAG: hypothetical protein NPIRA02_31710 [Nitrospirales bacterium]